MEIAVQVLIGLLIGGAVLMVVFLCIIWIVRQADYDE